MIENHKHLGARFVSKLGKDCKLVDQSPENKEAGISMEKLRLRLVGKDGNAFAILGVARQTAKKVGWSKDQIDTFMKEAMAGNYDHLLQTCMKYFEVS